MTITVPQQKLNNFLDESRASGFLDAEFAAFMDHRDPLNALRNEFVIPKKGEISPGSDNPEDSCIYFCGNSLGLLPKAVARYVKEEIEVWGEGA
ncbi:Kynureninase (L-kynurenine hydrolase), partial [Haplosporangium bisporale]